MKSWVLDTPDEGYAASCEAIDAMDLLGGLPGIAAPTLVISGCATLRPARAPGPDRRRYPGRAAGGGRRRPHPQRRAARAAVTALILEHLLAHERTPTA